MIFEGAQGVLLDADLGFHPYTTWSRCTSLNALELINEMAPDSRVHQIGVMRSYAVRHGPGPFPTETDMLRPNPSEHNQKNEWQGPVRYGWFDVLSTRYALAVTGRMDSLMVTHMDGAVNFDMWNYCIGYKVSDDFEKFLGDSPARDGILKNIPFIEHISLSEKTEFTQTLSTAVPVLESCEPDDNKVIEKIESLVGQELGLVSRGPSATDVQILNPALFQ